MKSSTTWCQDSEIFLCQPIKIFVLWSWTQSCLYILSYLHVCARLMFTFIHWTNGIRYSIIVNINKQSAGNIISGQFSDTSCRLIFCQITDRIIICIRHDCGGPIIISWGCFSSGFTSDPRSWRWDFSKNRMMKENMTDYDDVGYGVAQPGLVTKDVVIIVFMFLLWTYSLVLTYRAWYKILYSDGEEGTNMWR